MKAILGTKIGMTSLFAENGKMFASTILHVEPNQILDIRTKEKDGYEAIQVGYGHIKEQKVSKPIKGQFKKAKSTPTRFIKELKNMTGYQIGDELKVNIFEDGEYVDVQGLTKGHGFTGSIKRHNFSIGPLGHGAGYPHRYIGSISGGRGGSQAQRVFKGTEMPGHYGHELVTVSNLLILKVDLEKNILIVKGAIPGPKNSLVKIKLANKKPNKKEEIKLFSNKANAKNNKIEIIEEEQPAVEVTSSATETKEAINE